MPVFPGAELKEGLDDPSLAFVFPSQAAAEAWARALAVGPDIEAVELDRFLGWDRFKEILLAEHRRERPAERLARTVWAAGLLARQERKPFLRRLAGPGKPSPAFVSFFARLPPALEGVHRALRALDIEKVLREDESFVDILSLREDYARFLKEKGLFEPAWERLSGAGASARREATEENRRRYLIIAPELIEDFDEYAEDVRGLPFVELLPLPRTTALPRLYRFDNSYEELRSVFLRIAELLDGGIQPEEIVVTLPKLDEARPYVERAARLAGVPAFIRSGEPLSASPFGRLLAEIRGSVEADFDLPSLRALLLDRFASFKEAELAKGLIRFGIERHAYASYAVGGRWVDIWEESFKTCGAPQSLVSFYRRLRAALRSIVGATDFTALRKGLTAFRNQFLDEGGWTETERRRVERVMAELEDLARVEEELGARGELPSPFALFLTTLGTVGYVPQSGERAVSIYPYRVSALIPGTYHFVLGCSHEGIRVNYDRAPFLRADQKERLDRLDVDASVDFARAYLLSGEFFVASYAEESLSGWAVPHPFFLGPGAEEPSAPPELAALREKDPIGGETLAFRGERPMPERLLRFQLESIRANLPTLAERPPRYDLRPADEAVRARILRRVSREDGFLRLSATHLKEYGSCPFAWLLGRGLGLEEEPSGVDFFDARLAGEMAHAAIRRFFEDTAPLGPMSAGRLEVYRRAARKALEEVLPEFVAQEGPFLVPMFEAYTPLLADRLDRLLDALLEEPGWEAGELELPLALPYPPLKAVLEGRIDRLARRGNDHAIVDYKKRRLPKISELLVGSAEADKVAEGPSAAPGLGDFQIPAYIALCEAGGRSVVKASYWSIEEARELVVVGEGGLRLREDYGPELEALDRAVKDMVAGLEAGRFGTAPPGSKGCEACAWKGVCREQYATE